MKLLLLITLLSINLQAQRFRPKIHSKGKYWHTRTKNEQNNLRTLQYKLKNGKITFGSRAILPKLYDRKTGYQLHHIIPWSLRTHEVVQRAAVVGFHVSSQMNGKRMEGYKLDGVHVHGHMIYNKYVLKQLDLFLELNPEATEHECYDYLKFDLLPRLRDELDVCRTSRYKTMDEYFGKIMDFHSPYFDL